LFSTTRRTFVEKVFAGGMTLQQAAEIARPRKHEVLVFYS
jgi:hypothetical protein